MIIPFTYMPFINFPFENCRFHRRLFFAHKTISLGAKVYTIPTVKTIFGWGDGGNGHTEQSSIASKLVWCVCLLSICFALNLARDSACWGRLTCAVTSSLTEAQTFIYVYFGTRRKFSPSKNHTYFLITNMREEKKKEWAFAEMVVHHVLSITEISKRFTRKNGL